MDHERFREWFSHVDELTTAQCKEVAAVLSDPPVGAASLAAIELGVDDERRCPHCASAGAVSRGRHAVFAAIGARPAGRHSARSRARALSGLHHKERWLAFGASLGAGETIREAAERCGIAPSTRIAGVTASWRRCAKRRTGLPGSSRRTRPSFSRAGRGSGSWIASRAGAAARPANAASRASRCRSWSPPIAPAQPSATPCPPSTQRA